MSETVASFFFLGFWGFVAAVVVAAFWFLIRSQQMRNQLILKMLESGRPIDQETLDKLLSPTRRPQERGASDPRAGYRFAAFIDFLIGFGTLLIAFTRDGGISWGLAALALAPIVLGLLIWSGGDREYRRGTLPTLRHARDPREPSQTAGGIFFFIGYGTVFFAIVRGAGLSYPVVVLGILAMLAAVAIWVRGDREYREELLAAPPSGEEGR